ncbi:hypothetical protein [uncultured Pantoea sp.]|uniref:hypothetical protein n=1 Tax=uncultured Pantoea sp. TaxID=218084 RepID=UPI0025DA57BE|nr:hypothetical protein [uncultured Pantoea sp.]
MRVFYTLDRSGKLVDGLQINDGSFKSTSHSNNYNSPNATIWNQQNDPGPLLEWALEAHRKALFANAVSRFNCIFAWEDLETAKWFRGFSRSPLSTPIYEVHSDGKIHKGDMYVYNAQCGSSEFTSRLDAYWSSSTRAVNNGLGPAWEILVELPATIGKRVA